MSTQNRRRHERLNVPPMYTGVLVRHLDSEVFTLEGHAYDVSEGGVQFELDRGIAPGTAIALQIQLPTSVAGGSAVDGAGRAVFVFANIVWMDDSEPGPVRLAAVFTRFARAGDEERLSRALAGARQRRAAA